MISVIVPVYKTEPWLRQCVDSILGQTFSDLEIILVDDGSPDGCPAICDQYAKKDSRVRVIHKPNGGPASAVAAGVQAAAGEYIGFVDSDDWIDPDYYADLYRGITQTGADAVEAERVLETRPPLVRGRAQPVVYEGPEQIRLLLRQFFLAFLEQNSLRWPVSYSRCDKLYRRALWTDSLSLMDGRIVLDDDRMENAAVLSACGRFVLLAGTAKYHYRQTAGSVSRGRAPSPPGSVGRLSAALDRIARLRGLETEPVQIYVGGAAYRQIYAAAGQTGVPLREKCARIKALLAETPPGALEKYARARGGLFIRLYCAMLRTGLAAPCVWMAALHAALQSR